MIEFTLSFSGNYADENMLDLYDAAQAMLGFHRSLAITTHLVLHDEVITQATALSGAQIVSIPPESGSWKIPVAITSLAVGAYGISTAPQDTPLGHLVFSAYDYVISESLGFNVDYEKSLGQQYNELKESEQNSLPILSEERFDSAIEKCENAIAEMHRPISKSKSAELAKLHYCGGSEAIPFGHPLNFSTYEYLRVTINKDDRVPIEGKVSSYNINTFKGRIFVFEHNRAVPFELADVARDLGSVLRITESLSRNASDPSDRTGNIGCVAIERVSRAGRLKSYLVIEVL